MWKFAPHRFDRNKIVAASHKCTDLASGDAFLEWKEDESDDHIDGKLKAVIQTVDWFAWLEEDEEGEDDDDNEEE